MRRRPIRVIRNGTAPPRALLTKPEVNNFFDLPDGQSTVIGQISSLVSYKGHSILLDAAKLVLNQHPECLFLMVGYERSEQGYRESLIRKAVALGIADRVRIAGYPGPIGDVWSVIDIHVHASLLDSLPNALLEAMSLGKPSVVTSVGGVPEVIRNEVNGLLVAPNNPEDLASALLALLSDASKRASIGDQAKNTYSEHFQSERMTRELEGAFEDMVARSSKVSDG